MTRRVLFVVEVEKLRQSLTLMLEPLQREWELHFCPLGREGLARLDESSFDTLVTDTRISGIEVTDFLAEVRRRHPTVVRIALAGSEDQALLVRLVTLAHRILPKPCDAVDLHSAIQRAHSLGELLRSPALAAVVGRLGSIPTLSTLYQRIAEELTYPDYSLAAVGDLVAQDVGIAAKVIQLANSALIGLRRPAATPNQAVRILGADTTQTQTHPTHLFSRYNPNHLKPFSIEALWTHSQQVAELAGRIAAYERAGDKIIREAGLAGLFHDIGRLTLASQLPGPYKEVFAAQRLENLSSADVERKVLGASHAEVGAYLLGLWGLPDQLVEAVAWHHNPLGCPGTNFTALTAIHAADAILRMDQGEKPDMEYLARLGLAERFSTWVALRHPPKEEEKKT